MKKTNDRRIQIAFDASEELKKQIKIAAVNQNKSVTEWLIEAAKEKLSENLIGEQK